MEFGLSIKSVAPLQARVTRNFLMPAPWRHGGRCGQPGAGHLPAKKQKGPPKRSFAASVRQSAVLT
jgi:hypothetical protein